jgi:hypothetical protein
MAQTEACRAGVFYARAVQLEFQDFLDFFKTRRDTALETQTLLHAGEPMPALTHPPEFPTCEVLKTAEPRMTHPRPRIGGLHTSRVGDGYIGSSCSGADSRSLVMRSYHGVPLRDLRVAPNPSLSSADASS